MLPRCFHKLSQWLQTPESDFGSVSTHRSNFWRKNFTRLNPLAKSAFGGLKLIWSQFWAVTKNVEKCFIFVENGSVLSPIDVNWSPGTSRSVPWPIWSLWEHQSAKMWNFGANRGFTIILTGMEEVYKCDDEIQKCWKNKKTFHSKSKSNETNFENIRKNVRAGYAMQWHHLVVILESVAFNRKMTRAKQPIDDMDQMHHAFNLSIWSHFVKWSIWPIAFGCVFKKSWR